MQKAVERVQMVAQLAQFTPKLMCSARQPHYGSYRALTATVFSHWPNFTSSPDDMGESREITYEFESELASLWQKIPPSPSPNKDNLARIRAGLDAVYTLDKILRDFPVLHSERSINGPHGDLKLLILSPPKNGGEQASSTQRPGVLYIHGGGMVMGNRYFGVDIPAEWVVELGAVCVSVEYRLAPENPYPVPTEECFAAFKWMQDNCGELGVDPEKLVISGISAGGGLAAAVALMLRDQGASQPRGQLLMCPMLDDRMDTASCQQFANMGSWIKKSNEFSYQSFLQGRQLREGEKQYAVPGRVQDLSNLPNTFIDVGWGEIYRDEALNYAQRLSAAAVDTELHLWSGAFHAFDLMFPHAKLSMTARNARKTWLQRLWSN